MPDGTSITIIVGLGGAADVVREFEPAVPLETLVHEFLRFVTAKEGQTIVVKDGYYPLPASVAAATLAQLQ